MKKYIIVIFKNRDELKFASHSRDAKKHLRNNGGDVCKILTMKGEQIAEARYTPEDGGKYYSCNFDRGIYYVVHI